uniref:Uncharacterized protein n=1 Tax=Arundo donax TaxID=35708 RepID=A0A0A9A7J4_ARUDO
MLQDQMWHKTARPGELNYNFMKKWAVLLRLKRTSQLS